MIRVKRGNIEKVIPKIYKGEFLKKGFAVVEEKKAEPKKKETKKTKKGR